MKVWAELTDIHRGFFAGILLTAFCLVSSILPLCSINLYLFFFFFPCCFPPFPLAPSKCHIVSLAISLLSFPGLAARAAPAEESVVRMLGIHRRRTGSGSRARVDRDTRKEAYIPLCTASKILKEQLVFANSSVLKSPRAIWVL